MTHPSNSIADSVLPIKRAEELLATLPGVIAAKIIVGSGNAVDEIHVLTSSDVPPKQTVRNIESALIAHLGMKIDHRKISVATSAEPEVARGAVSSRDTPSRPMDAVVEHLSNLPRREMLFEDVEVRRSRTKGISVRVTLRKGDASLTGEAEGAESDRSRIELAARAALDAIQKIEPDERTLAIDGARQIDAFDRTFVFVAVTARLSRSTVLLTGSCEVKESAETASVLAVLDATNRWLTHSH